jgi:hypothetical protein
VRIYEGLQRNRDRLAYADGLLSGPPPVLVDISNVAEYYSLRGQKRLTTRDFPKTLSPWRSGYYEHRYFPVAGVDEEGIDRLIDRFGYWVNVEDRAADGPAFEAALAVVKQILGRPLPVAPLSVRFIQFVHTFELFHRENGRAPIAEGLMVMLYGYEGELVGAPEGGMGAILYSPRLSHDPQAMTQYMTDVFYGAGPLFLAISLAHCKNVRVIDHRTPPKVAAKRAKAGKPVGVTYKTLVIDGMKETLRTEGGIERNGLKKALHICRGHFATYTADKPLFGRVTGTVWRPMHTRGSKERGEVVKDYKVKAPPG